MTIKVTYNVTDVYVTQDVSPVYINVSYSSGSSGGSAVWGGITGTLSDQTDLQTALDAKVPYSGATANVDLGEYELKAGQVEFDQTPTGTAGVAVMRWNDSDGTLDLGLKGGNVTLQLGQEQVARVVNKSGVNLLESAYQVVKVTDAQGQRLAVDLAQGNNDANSTDTIGIVTENIDNNQEGFITTSGIVRNINTTGSLQGETWNDGDVLYLSPTTAGAITNIKPTAPNHTVILGYVVYAHAVNGKIFVKCDNGYEIGELHDCYLPTPSNNDGIFWNSTNLRYENKSVSSALGYTPANSATTLTINGVTYDLSTSRTWTISAGISGSGASGQVSYWDGTTSQAGSANFQWNGTNIVLGNDKGLVLQTSGTNRNVLLRPTVIIDNYAGLSMYPNSGTNVGFSLSVVPRGTGLNSQIKSQITVFNTDYTADSTNYELGIFRAGGDRFSFATGAAGTGTNRPFLLSSGYADGVTNANQLWLYTNGNVGINTTTNGSERLQVQGTTLLNGNVTFSSATGMFWDATNSRLGIGTNAPVHSLDILRNGSGAYYQSRTYRDSNFAGGFVFLHARGTSASPSYLLANDRLASIFFKGYDGTVANDGNGASIESFAAANHSGTETTADLRFSTNDGGLQVTEKMRLTSTGRLLLQNGGTFTDSGERLQVTGTMKVTSNVTFSDCVNYNDTTKSLNVVNNLATSVARGISVSQHADSVAGALINYNRSRGSSTTPTNVSSGDLVGLFVFNARVGGAYTSDRALLGSSMTSATGISLYMISGTSDANYTPTILAHHSGNVGIGLGGSIITTVTEPTALLDLAASSTARASLRIRSGTAPTSPNNGDIWFDGTDIKMRIGGVTKTFTLI